MLIGNGNFLVEPSDGKVWSMNFLFILSLISVFCHICIKCFFLFIVVKLTVHMILVVLS